MNQEKVYKKRTSFWPTIISMSLVLFIVGLLGIVSIYARHMAAFYQDNFEVFVFFSDTVSADDAREAEARIRKYPFINSSLFVDKEITARKEIAATGNDFIKTLGYNPFPHSLELNVKTQYVDEEKMKDIEKQLRALDGVDDVRYAKDEFGNNILAQINKNFKTIELVLSGIALIMLLISLALINSTVRINMFARRFIIKSMQYVGASDGFIIRPFLGMYCLYAILSVLIACLMLSGAVYLAETHLGQNNWQLFMPEFLLLALFLLVLALIISLLSVYFATKRYLKLKIDQLY